MAANDRFYHQIVDGLGQPMLVRAALPVIQAPLAGMRAPVLSQRRIAQSRFGLLLRCPAPAGALLGGMPGAMLGALRDHVVSIWPGPGAEVLYFAATIHFTDAYHELLGQAVGAPPMPVAVGFVELTRSTDISNRIVTHHPGPGMARPKGTRVDLATTDFGPGAIMLFLGIDSGGAGTSGGNGRKQHAAFADAVRCAVGGACTLTNLTYSTDFRDDYLPAPAAGPEAARRVDALHKPADRVLVEAKKIVYVTSPAAEPDFEAWVTPGEMYIEPRMPKWWIANNRSWRELYRRWHMQAQPGAGPPEIPEIIDFSTTPEAYQWLCTREVLDRKVTVSDVSKRFAKITAGACG